MLSDLLTIVWQYFFQVNRPWSFPVHYEAQISFLTFPQKEISSGVFLEVSSLRTKFTFLSFNSKINSPYFFGQILRDNLMVVHFSISIQDSIYEAAFSWQITLFLSFVFFSIRSKREFARHRRCLVYHIGRGCWPAPTTMHKQLSKWRSADSYLPQNPQKAADWD